ncbi:MAG: cytochrome c [Bacteroidota bacterium]|nr:cytochrome c [Bacteroidota bacterium]
MQRLIVVVFLSFLGDSAGYGQSVTYQTVEPIFLNKCASCHRAGDAAPFPLTSYRDITKRLSFIKAVIGKGYMPPWRADAHYRDFANTRFLTDEEKKTILQWIADKAPEGDDRETEGEKEALLKRTAYNRDPDLTLKIDSSFTIHGDNVEKFIDFKVPFEFAETHNIEAIELYTNNKRIIHHVNYGFYEVADSSVAIFGGRTVVNSEDVDRTKPDPFDPLKKKMIYYTGWIPGSSVENYPKGFGWTLPRRGVLILTAHYTATAVDEQSIVGVNLFFRKDSIKRPIQIISLGSGGIAENDITPPLFIPANRISKFHLKVKTNDEQSLMYVWPHMHLLGKEFYAYAVTPENDTINLVHIPNWDFRWQELYKLKSLLRIPKGSVINLDCTYDNTTNNLSNPNNPPQGVFSFGDMSATNEMMTLLLIYTPYREGDEKISLEEQVK